MGDIPDISFSSKEDSTLCHENALYEYEGQSAFCSFKQKSSLLPNSCKKEGTYNNGKVPISSPSALNDNFKIFIANSLKMIYFYLNLSATCRILKYEKIHTRE